MRRSNKMKCSLLLLTLAVSIVVCSSLAYGQPVKNGLIAYWSFDMPTVMGRTIEDLAGNYNGKMEGDPKIITGRHGQAIEFDGVDDYLDLTILEGFGSHLGTFSIDFWLKTGITPDWTTLFKTVTDGASMLVSIDLNRSEDHAKGMPYEEGVTFPCVRDNTGKLWSMGINTDIYDNAWHHIGWVVEDASSNTCKVYVDGKEVEVEYGAMDTPTDFADFQYPVYLGAANNRGNIERFCPAAVDEFRIYDRALSAAEILESLASGAEVERSGKLTATWAQVRSEY